MKILAAGMAFSLVQGCGGKDYQHTSFRLPPTSTKELSRVNLIRIYSQGALEAYFTSIDFGVERVVTENANLAEACRILEPSHDEVRGRSASPSHLYSNKTPEEVQGNKGVTDANEVFFEGDQDNRNGRTDSHEWTQIPKEEYFEFRKVTKRSDSRYDFVVHFDRGGHVFTGTVIVKTFPNEDKCETAAYICTEVDEFGQCLNDDSARRFESLTVHISAWRYPWGKYVRKIVATPFGGNGPEFEIGG